MAEFERTFCLQVPSSTQNLQMIREFVTNVAHQAKLEDGEIMKIEMAVDEASANVMEHAYDSDLNKEVTVRVRFDADVFEIDIIDTGRFFDPSTVPAVDLKSLVASRSSGGLGIPIIKRFMDEVHYHMLPGSKNELRMIKHLRKAEG